MLLTLSRPARDFAPYVLLLLFSACLMLVASNEGWLMTEFPRMDASWYFMAGKGWMSGLTPYVDFTDSKGPLLWLIYGLGYLLSPRSMHGMFFIETLFYWATFIYLYKTVGIYVKDRNRALLGSMAMAIFFFQPWMHKEIRAEDYCNLFNALTFYSLTAIFKKGNEGFKPYFLLGLAVGGTLLIKYNVALMLLVPSGVAAVWILARRPSAFPRHLLWWMAGFAAVTLPFAAMFLAMGNFGAFIREYFLLTFQTIEAQHPYSSHGDSLWLRWPMVILTYIFTKSFHWTLGIKLSFLSILFVAAKCFRPSWLKVSILLWYAAALVLTTYMVSERYLNILGIFCVAPVICVLRRLPGLSLPASILGGAVTLFIVSYSLLFCPYGEFYDTEGAMETVRQRERIATLVDAFAAANGDKPTIMFVRTYDNGYGIQGETLPGSKYWSQQAGATYEMKKRHTDDIFALRPDFLVVPAAEVSLLDSIESAGYRRLYTYYPPIFPTEPDPEPHHLYARPDPFPDSFTF